MSEAGDATRGRQGRMEYLAYKLVWWMAFAFAIGLVIGWLSCSPMRE